MEFYLLLIYIVVSVCDRPLCDYCLCDCCSIFSLNNGPSIFDCQMFAEITFTIADFHRSVGDGIPMTEQSKMELVL